jgi:signal transduction histidine kinase
VLGEAERAELLPRPVEAEASLVRRRTGTRLSLATVKALVDKLGGTVQVSETGAGTHIVLHIPRGGAPAG